MDVGYNPNHIKYFVSCQFYSYIYYSACGIHSIMNLFMANSRLLGIYLIQYILTFSLKLKVEDAKTLSLIFFDCIGWRRLASGDSDIMCL